MSGPACTPLVARPSRRHRGARGTSSRAPHPSVDKSRASHGGLLMAKLQCLRFGLATLVLVVLATFYFMRPWLPPLKSDRVAIDHAIGLSLAVTGVVFIVTNLLLAWVGF